MEIETKNKIKNIFKGIYVAITTILSFGFIACLAVGCSQKNKTQVACAESESINVEVNKKFVSYNDDNETILFTPYELQNYTWRNVYDSIYNDFYLNDSLNQLYVNSTYGDELEENNFSIDGCFYTDKNHYYLFIGDTLSHYNEFMSANAFSNYTVFVPYKFYFAFESEGDIEYLDFTNYDDFRFSFDSKYYDFKSAVELDIQANNSTINDGIFETLTESSVSFIGTIGSGIIAMVGVFYDSTNSQLTTIGLLSVIVVSIGLAYFFFRLIIGLIRMRG